MRSKPFYPIVLVLCAVIVLPAWAHDLGPGPEGWADRSLWFVENGGQFPSWVRYQASAGAATLWLGQDALWLTARGPDQAAYLRLRLDGANPRPRLEPMARQETVFHYYRGRDPAAWQSGVPSWGGVRYRDLYPGVDLEIAGRDGGLAWRLAFFLNLSE